MFPTELIDIITDHLHDDWSALRVCTLVSRTWTVSARYHLFRHISIPLASSDGDSDLREAVRSFESPLGKQYGAYVRLCTVKALGTLFYWMKEPCIDLVTLGQLLSSLPRLGTLRLINIAWPAPSIRLPASLASTSVTSLVVCRVESSQDYQQQYKTIRDGMAVLCLLPSLKSLTTLRSCWGASSLRDSYPSVEPSLFPHGLELETLDLRADGPACILINYAIECLNFSALTTLSIWSFYTEDIPSIGKLIRAAAHSLQSLELRLTRLVFWDDPNDRE
ncbi:hypothetical protein BDY19DRAFT_949393 [Irpex rosettiformis]|uniref:Uncharacterized protein n=1 Tax=Irpex rosettiformis TaxID=378272 RepID=A0ACB8U282_9APHY|nr:hypothetical protein BDY19DRAFT_949393 [Irpex rosettiformis]